jgi:hypothetical protein
LQQLLGCLADVGFACDIQSSRDEAVLAYGTSSTIKDAAKHLSRHGAGLAQSPGARRLAGKGACACSFDQVPTSASAVVEGEIVGCLLRLIGAKLIDFELEVVRHEFAHEHRSAKQTRGDDPLT